MKRLMLAKLNGRSMMMEAMTSLVEVAPMVVEEVKNLAVITIANLTEMEVDPVIVTLTVAMFKLQFWKLMLQESNVGTALNPNVKKTRIIMAAKLFALKESKGAWLVEIDGMTGFIDHVSGNSKIQVWIKLD